MSTKLEKRLLALIQEANQNWDLFKEGDRLLVGISGGKDSLSMLTLLSHFKVDLHAVHIRLSPTSPIDFLDYCKHYSTVHLVETTIYEQAFAQDANKNPCFICMRQRRKMIVTFAMEQTFDRIFYGHHKNDVVETFLLNQLFGRELSTILPKQPLFDNKFYLCRPLYLVPEPLLETYAREQNFPTVLETCPAAKNSQRNHIKTLLHQLQEQNPKIDLVDNIFSSMKRINMPFIPTFPDTKILTDIRKPNYK
ncbi:MAG: ATP-binding protein, partial [Candidatus Marinimicrobia bacterium]|nr:ATP-binding protein [Candidatus Neomarinimicrobiota bacterium]